MSKRSSTIYQLTKPRNGGFTLVELLVVIAIIGVLVSLLLPAVHAARGAAYRTQCQNNIRQIGIAIINYETAHGELPHSGQGLTKDSPPKMAFNKQSTFALILPYLEETSTYERIDLTTEYNATPENQEVAKHVVSAFVCPANYLRPSSTDKWGFGCVDYGPTIHCNMNPETGTPDSKYLTLGALGLNPTRMAKIKDGTSHTIMVAEDAGRKEDMTSLYIDPIEGGDRKQWRWADPDNAFGVSWPVNTFRTPFGGPPECPWTKMNCGPNDEIFSFHPGGANVVFVDGHIQFLPDSTSYRSIRALVSRAGRDAMDEADLP